MNGQDEPRERVEELEAKFGKGSVQKTVHESGMVEVVGGRWLSINIDGRNRDVCNLDNVMEIYFRKEGSGVRLEIYFKPQSDCTKWTLTREMADEVYRQLLEALDAAGKERLLMGDGR